MTDEIPEPIRKFIAANIASIRQLEALLLLREHSTEFFSATEIALKLYCQPEMMDRQLAPLIAAGILAAQTATEGDQPMYQYRPGTEQLSQLVDQLAQIYRDRRVAVTTLIYSDDTQSLRSFSDAFRFRKDSN